MYEFQLVSSRVVEKKKDEAHCSIDGDEKEVQLVWNLDSMYASESRDSRVPVVLDKPFKQIWKRH